MEDLPVTCPRKALMPWGVELKARNGSWFPFPMSRALRQVVCSSQAVYTSVHLNQRVWWAAHGSGRRGLDRWVLRLGVSGKAGSGP